MTWLSVQAPAIALIAGAIDDEVRIRYLPSAVF